MLSHRFRLGKDGKLRSRNHYRKWEKDRKNTYCVDGIMGFSEEPRAFKNTLEEDFVLRCALKPDGVRNYQAIIQLFSCIYIINFIRPNTGRTSFGILCLPRPGLIFLRPLYCDCLLPPLFKTKHPRLDHNVPLRHRLLYVRLSWHCPSHQRQRGDSRLSRLQVYR